MNVHFAHLNEFQNWVRNVLSLILISYNPGVLFSGTWQREVKGLAIPKVQKAQFIYRNVV